MTKFRIFIDELYTCVYLVKSTPYCYTQHPNNRGAVTPSYDSSKLLYQFNINYVEYRFGAAHHSQINPTELYIHTKLFCTGV
jgi:hypothetical protein